MTVQEPAITIPRLEGESNKAYATRVEYILMGPGRSFDKLRRQNAGKSGLSTRRSSMEQWSVQFNWQEHARRYDDTVAAIAAQRDAEQYVADLEEHRKRYQKTGRDLHTIATALLNQCARAVRGEVIYGADGKEYYIPSMELTPNTFSTAVRGLVVAADLEAHALRIAELLPRLDYDPDSE